MKEQMDKIIQLVKDNPNDMELGRKVREEINNFSTIEKIIKNGNQSGMWMARDVFGNRKLTKEDMNTKGRIQFSRSDEIFEYFKMFVILVLGFTYLLYIFK